MNSLTIDSAFPQAQAVWFQTGLEDLRGAGVDWLVKPNRSIPAIFARIAQNLGISIRSAISLGKLIEDQKTAGYLERSKEFQAMPLAVLGIFQKAQELYKSRVKNPNSSGAADVKVMYGQWRGDNLKPGLIVKLGDYFSAHMAYYMAIGGWTAVRDVRRATGWSMSRLKELLLIAIREINWMKKTIGLRTLNSLSKTMDRGMHFFASVFTVLNAKLKAKDIQVARGENEEDVTDGEIDDGEEEITDVTLEPHNPDPDHDDPEDAHDDLTAKPHGDVFDDPNRVDPDDAEPHAKLKTGRELAFSMISAAKKAANENPRHQQLMAAIDDKILVNALQKDSKNQQETAERMTTFLSFCWQWAGCTGIFSENEYLHLVDAPPESVIKQITKAVQKGYWESGDNKRQDVPKIWVDVTHTDEEGRTKLAKLVQPCSPVIKTKPHMANGLRDGRVAVVNPGLDLPAYFFPNRKKPPADENLRYFITSDGMTETITCQQYIHPRKSSVDHAITLNDDFDMAGADENNSHETDIDALDLDDKNMAMVAEMLGISPDLLIAAKFGDERALAVILKAASGMDDDQRDDLMAALMQQ